MNSILSIFLMLCFLSSTIAQAPSNRQVKIKKALGEITLDGILSEKDWLEAAVASDFYQNLRDSYDFL